MLTGRGEQELNAAEAGVRRLLSFYGSTPAYRVTLEAHGWGDLQTELNTLSKQGRWDDMPRLIDDEIVDALAVRGEPASIGARVQERYRGLDTEMYREFAHVQGRMIGVPYAEGLDVMRMLLA